MSVVAPALRRGFIGRPSREASGPSLRSGAVLLPTTRSVWSLTPADRLFLGPWVSAAEPGYYDIANKIAGLAYVATAPARHASPLTSIRASALCRSNRRGRSSVVIWPSRTITRPLITL
ncbi:MAG: hypothetical protein KatS3mg052_2666 [Candidatus Roseilinea sp.]|nr:MAG: hypothetical protein KatS3mg052_2666 [Candidatus Roseilinea sp.]